MMRRVMARSTGCASAGADAWHRRPLRVGWRLLTAVALTMLLGVLSLAPRVAVNAAGWQGAGTLPGDYGTPLVVLLPDGRALAVARKEAATYTFATNSWAATGAPPFDLAGAELVVLADGQVLAAGGAVSNMANNPFAIPKQTALFDPGKGIWTKGPDMPNGRADHTLIALATGKILAVGGVVGGLSPRQPVTTVGGAELYDPATGAWSATGSLRQPRYGHTATLLPDGRVLVAGGAVSKTVNSENGGADLLSSAELYDPVAGIWQTVAPLSKLRSGHVAVPLLDGTVLVIGGEPSGATTAERYDPQANSWSAAGTLGVRITGFSATPLLGGDVLVVGGRDQNSNPLTAVRRYTPGTNGWQSSDPLPVGRGGHGAALIDGHVLVVGGQGAATTADRYDATPPGTTCFVETGRCAGGTFLAYWQAHGQLPINGYPLGNPFPERLENGKVYVVQYFERVRMEAHPENAAPNDILLGQFGRRIHAAAAAVSPKAGATFFDQTGHNLDGAFLAYWQANGGVAQFGYPLTEVLAETLEDGKSYQVQYFERARFEAHPENAAPYDVLLGQFGRRILAGR